MDAVGARFFLFIKRLLKILLESAIRNPKIRNPRIIPLYFLADFCKNLNPNPTQKFGGFPNLTKIILMFDDCRILQVQRESLNKLLLLQEEKGIFCDISKVELTNCDMDLLENRHQYCKQSYIPGSLFIFVSLQSADSEIFLISQIVYNCISMIQYNIFLICVILTLAKCFIKVYDIFIIFHFY